MVYLYEILLAMYLTVSFNSYYIYSNVEQAAADWGVDRARETSDDLAVLMKGVRGYRRNKGYWPGCHDKSDTDCKRNGEEEIEDNLENSGNCKDAYNVMIKAKTEEWSSERPSIEFKNAFRLMKNMKQEQNEDPEGVKKVITRFGKNIDGSNIPFEFKCSDSNAKAFTISITPSVERRAGKSRDYSGAVARMMKVVGVKVDDKTVTATIPDESGW